AMVRHDAFGANHNAPGHLLEMLSELLHKLARIADLGGGMLDAGAALADIVVERIAESLGAVVQTLHGSGDECQRIAQAAAEPGQVQALLADAALARRRGAAA